MSAARTYTLGLFFVAVMLSGCAAVGPETINRDRFDYGMAIGDSWKRQTLMNLVRLRYSDAPVFMEVSSVINQYNLEGEVEVGGDFVTGGSNVRSIGATGTYYDRPTISYAPLQGKSFTRSILRPLPPAAVFYLMQAGWPADLVMRLAVRAVNGIYGQTRLNAIQREADPRFSQLLSAMRRMQETASLGLRVETREGQDSIVALIRRRVADESESDRVQLRQILGLDPSASEFRLAFGLLPRDDREIALLTRSMLEIMAELATGVDVPARHEKDGWAPKPMSASEAFPPLITVRSGPEKPDNSFASIPYQNHWFWIENADIRSKRTLIVLMFFFSLAEDGDTPLAPVVTINAGS